MRPLMGCCGHTLSILPLERGFATTLIVCLVCTPDVFDADSDTARKVAHIAGAMERLQR